MKSLKQKLLNKELTIGSWLSFGYTPICEMMAKSGFEWLVIDMEHTATDYYNALQMIQVINICNCIPLVRVGANDELLIKRVMDSGAHGVIVPMVNTKEDAERAVSYIKYPPFGKRGVGLFRAQAYGMDFGGYQKWVEEESICIVQIEHFKGVENLNDILSVEGVDGFIVGPYDLSGSIGIPGDFNNPNVVELMEEVTKFVKKSNKPGGFHIVHSDHKLLKSKIDDGYKFIAYGDDMVFLAEKIKEENKFLLNFK
ncbi:MAG: aldolase/citrate lyase family protein [Ignavibacteriales bacterium]|nr:aldolase/citrate lyase family protein [Ignavibacteriales bacterium]